MKVSVQETDIQDVKVVTPSYFKDDRGFFTEMFRADEYAAVGLPTQFVQINHSGSVKNTVRGLHFQWDPPMGKLMTVLHGEAFLVAVDIRPNSPTLGKHFATTIVGTEGRMVWAPAGFARGFAVLSPSVEILYLTTGTYNAKAESGIAWDDPALDIAWPVREPILSIKDQAAPTLAQWLDRPESASFSLEAQAA